MPETSPSLHNLLCALAGADKLLCDLPEHQIPNEKCDLTLRAFSFLCHAAIEEYLEDVSRYVLRASSQYLKDESKLCQPLVAACLYYRVPILEIQQIGVTFADRRDFFIHAADEAWRQHSQVLNENNGIKTRDQDALLLPIGCRIFDFDRILSQNLNSLGEQRGKIAHTFRMQMKVPKAGLQSNINILMKLIISLDQFLCEQLNTTHPL